MIIAAPSKNADICWATGFWAPDPAVFFEVRGKRYLILRDLEVDRARKTARVAKVFAASDLEREIRAKHKLKANIRIGYAEMVHHLFSKMKVKSILVPQDFGVAYADILRRLKYRISTCPGPFYAGRALKTPKEVQKVREVMATTERALKKAIDVIAKSRISGDKLLYQGKALTSEFVRDVIHQELMAGQCIADLNTIVACGAQTADPHEVGEGLLRPHRPIILDVFPRSLEHGYYGDITRTVVKGKAPKEVKRMYQAVYDAVNVAARMYRPNVHAPEIFKAVHDVFARRGFQSGEINGTRQGFIHGVGHGVGLDIHEEPTVGSADRTLAPGHLVTLEPGLYYRKFGGVRIEDLYLITKNGARRLTRFPHLFEV